MRTRPNTRRIALALAGAGAVALLTACGSSVDPMEGHTGTGSPSPSAPLSASASGAAFNSADVMFAQMMIPHHEQAVRMAELAEAQAVNPEIKALAGRIEAAQDTEIQTMEDWLAAWGRPLPSGMGHEMPGMASSAEMKELAEAKGAEFDRRFATLMIAHHEGAITMAKAEQAQGLDPAVKALAKEIDTAQRSEIAQLRKALNSS